MGEYHATQIFLRRAGPVSHKAACLQSFMDYASFFADDLVGFRQVLATEERRLTSTKWLHAIGETSATNAQVEDPPYIFHELQIHVCNIAVFAHRAWAAKRFVAAKQGAMPQRQAADTAHLLLEH